MKNVWRITLVGLVISMIAVAITLFTTKEPFYKGDQIMSDQEILEAFELLNQSLNQSRYSYFEYISSYDMKMGDEIITIKPDPVEKLYYEDQVQYKVHVNENGLYYFGLDYKMDDSVLNNGTIKITIDGVQPFYEASTIDLPLFWQDETKNFILDSYGDEALPIQKRKSGIYHTDFYNNLYYTVDPLCFYLSKGEHEIVIQNVSSSIFVPGDLTLTQPKAIPTYEAYYQDVPLKDITISVNATEYTLKNSSYVRLMSYDSPTVSPNDPVDKKLNIISGESWVDPGKEITFEVEVEETGNYKLAFHSLPGKDDFQVFRTLRIDGEIPFKEVSAYGIKDTKANLFSYETLSNEKGKPYEFYLTQGKHEISLRADYAPIAADVRMIQLVIDHINTFSLDIRKITGKEVDKNRTWKLTDYLEDTEAYLKAYDLLIKSVINHTSAYAPNGVQSASLSYLQKALVQLDKMLEKPDELPLYFEELYSGSGSVNQMLGDSMEVLMEQPLTLDEFVFYTDTLDKKDNASIVQKQVFNFKKFIASFTSDKYVVKNDEDVLNVWVNRPITHVDTLQKLVDSEFTPKTGIKVKISVMPDANKLILASAAKEAPDVAMGLLSYMPFDLAIRDAAYDLTSFDDFWEVANRFTPGAFVPYVLEDDIYALPETLEFYATVYRKDIFESLNLEVPDTWDEVIELLPELQRYGMNYYHPIAGGGSLKWFYQTSPFIYQKGGVLYEPDGLKAAIDEPEAVAGIDMLTKLFTMYALPEQEPLFYNSFRYGTLPIGITDFVSYMQIKNAAPELIGQWELAPYPGTVDENNEMNRWYIANGRGSTILKDTKRPEEAWEFLKWWTSESVQTNYSYTMQSIYGPEYLWLSSNLAAVQNSPLDVKDKMIILDQIKWLRDVPRTPGQYMLERGLSDIWNQAVFNGVPTRIAIDRQVITINREITRKMIEFGYLNQTGEVIKPYHIRDIDWIEEQMETRGK
ncbi:MAG: extracellular solute-binding protein [Clostridia bacterium]|nr:extracellular solute-binding protein [Clostridia bacterium]